MRSLSPRVAIQAAQLPVGNGLAGDADENND